MNIPLHRKNWRVYEVLEVLDGKSTRSIVPTKLSCAELTFEVKSAWKKHATSRPPYPKPGH